MKMKEISKNLYIMINRGSDYGDSPSQESQKFGAPANAAYMKLLKKAPYVIFTSKGDLVNQINFKRGGGGMIARTTMGVVIVAITPRGKADFFDDFLNNSKRRCVL